ncbi:MAG: LysR family transcriptional regulator, partial [Paraburkholderia tropica]
MDSLLTSASLRRLQVFLAVCETLHMARAAEQLGVAQPALSQQIKGLEEALGVRLFHRRKRG